MKEKKAAEFLKKFHDLQREYEVEVDGPLALYTREGVLLGDIEQNFDSIDLVEDGIVQASYSIERDS
jgi:hypothetical protein